MKNERCINVKNQVITEITRQMLPYLDNAQMEHLQEVLQHCLWNVEITSSGKNTELFVRETNEEMLEMFLSAKRVEGCSEKTLRYYETSLLRMFSEVDMHVTKMKTDDLRNYLSEYQQRTQCSRGNIDNIRRILSSFFAWLEDENYILKSPVRRIHKIRSCKTVKETYTDEALETMRDQCGSIRDLAMIDLLASTGMRVGDDDDKIRLNQRKPSKYKGLSRFGPEKNLQRINKFMKERPIFYKNLIQMKENFRFYLRCFYCITKVVILQFNSENRTELARNG